MSLEKIKVEGFEAFKAKVDELAAQKDKKLIVLFSGSTDSATGER